MTRKLTDKIIKFEIESSNGTLTDLTPFVKSVELKPYRPSIWRRLLVWVYWQWFKYKADKAWKKLSKEITIDIEFEQRPREPWRWN